MIGRDQVGRGDALIRSICKLGIFRQGNINLASILRSYKTVLNKEFIVSYHGANYRGIIDNQADWLVYYFGDSDTSRRHFVHKISKFVTYKTARSFTCYDVGAGRGHFSLSLATMIDHVVAFEQDDRRYAHLYNNIASSDVRNIVSHHVRLSDHDDHPGRTDAIGGHSAGLTKSGIASPTPCRQQVAKRGDTVVNEHRLPAPDLIRINAGHGYRSVLRGFESTLETHEPIVLIEQPAPYDRCFIDETDLRSVLYKAPKLLSLWGSPYRARYELDRFDPCASRIVCYAPKISRMIDQEMAKITHLRRPLGLQAF